jgi:predicted ArsR family transcriptional regulator
VANASDTVPADELLADRSRARLFALLADRARPATTSELAEAMQLHPNGVRRHLAALEAAGLVTRAHTEGGRGRPADTWMAAPGATAGPATSSAYRELARWLARAVAGGATEPDGMRAVGRAIGRELAADEGAPERDADDDRIGGHLASMGFAPQRLPMADGRTAFMLGNCPYCDAVRENQPAICGLHRGMTEGLLEVLLPAAELTRFVAEDPRSAGCLIEIAEPNEDR